jgi:isocitrate lyase
VAGGKGVVGPYAGGWQHNAMKNRLNMCLPDTLHVSPEESANCAAEINNHLHRADAVQNIQKIDNPDLNTVNYYDMAMLCDLEQGWCTPEKTRIATLLAIQNGINVIHIEDQGEKKRCGHLGDKELNTYDDYALIMRSANLAAQELLGPEQADKQWVRFVARTDALSAKRIHNSQLLYSNLNPENKFIDWEKGTSPDGKYLYLKQGINPETGNSWGLDLSIYRSSRIVDEGLASHVWMETPDADLNVAKAFMDGVNNILLPKGKRAYGLYNHSPSFDWDVKFFAEAEILADKIIEWSKRKIKRIDNINSINPDELHNMLCKEGEIIQGDHLFNNDELDSMCLNIIDYHMTEDKWHDNLKSLSKSNYEGFNSKEVDKYLTKKLQQGFSPKKEISNIIVERRLKEFGNQLSSFGCNMHLITLPEFHITAYNMHTLSQDFSDNGINAFVERTQRPERIHSENDNTYTYYKHQTATGTGVEAAFNQAVGSHDVNILNDSTEQDDIKKRF